MRCNVQYSGVYNFHSGEWTITMSVLLAQLAALTRNLGRLQLQNQRRAIPALFASAGRNQLNKSFASKKKEVGEKPPPARHGSEPALQHKEWVAFQQSIAVEGFETGQTTTVQSTKKTRGGKKATKRKQTRRDLMEEKLKERQRLTGAGGGEFPPLRYSDEETERLLAQAYAALPVRTGKRGTKNLHRQKRRWHLVREIRRKYKAHMANFQVRKMAKRSRKIREVKAIIDAAPGIRQRDREYQLSVYQRWAATMVADQQGESQQSVVNTAAGAVAAEENVDENGQKTSI